MAKLWAVLFALLLCSVLPAQTPAGSGTPGPQSPQALFRQGNFRAAAAAYQKTIELGASPEAYAGLIRSLLKLDDVAEAERSEENAVHSFPQSAAVLAAVGDVKFRQGFMAEAEDEYTAALKLDDNCARAWLGMGRIYSAASQRQRSRDAFARAYRIAPDDGDILYYWAAGAPYPENVAGLEKHLAEFRDDAERERHQREYIHFLKALAGRKVWVLARPVESTDLKLQPIIAEGRIAQPRSPMAQQSIIPDSKSRIRGYELQVRLNDRVNANVMLDTGASGLTIGRKLAEKAGATRLSEHSLEGVGNSGPASGYEAWVNKVTIGNLEFHDCHVHVSPRDSEDYDGLIGTDVFEDYLVTVDFAAHKLRLSPVPKPAPAGETKPAELQSATQFYRFGHILLLPTRVGTSARGLFAVDTGALTNAISPALARQVSMVRNSSVPVKGVSGNVKDVFTADEAVLQFSRFRQIHEDIITFDVHGLSKDLGTEVSGFLGFATLRKMKLIIDYRDGLIDFEYKGD
jgi:tetratricopeptide (TPR) repeat protein